MQREKDDWLNQEQGAGCKGPVHTHVDYCYGAVHSLLSNKGEPLPSASWNVLTYLVVLHHLTEARVALADPAVELGDTHLSLSASVTSPKICSSNV